MNDFVSAMRLALHMRQMYDAKPNNGKVYKAVVQKIQIIHNWDEPVKEATHEVLESVILKDGEY